MKTNMCKEEYMYTNIYIPVILYMWNTQLIFYVRESNCIGICNKEIHLHLLLCDDIMLSALNICTYTFKLGKRANQSIYTSKGKFYTGAV